MKPGTKIGKYEIARPIGRGGMADVYQAKDTELGRVVALKLLPPEFAREPERVARFMKEVKNSAAITHPNVVPVYDVGEGDGFYFYTMAYLPGGDLKGRIKSGIQEGVALNLLRQMAQALGAAHAKGIVHRDVKPENILFDESGRPIITDLGIARAMTGGTRMTKTGMSIGTPHYMSPEQARGKTVDARSDIYSLGVVFFEMLTGKLPFDAEDTFAVSYMHINDPVPALPAHLSKYQPLIDSMLAKEPNHRYPDCTALIQDIDRIKSGAKAQGTVSGPSPSSGSRRKKKNQNTGALKGLLIGTLSALIVAGGAYWYMEDNQPKIRQGGGGDFTTVQAQKSSTGQTPILLGSLKVTTTPQGASVTLNGINKGVSPLDIADLDPGSFTVRSILKGHISQSSRVTITGGSQASVHFDLKPEVKQGHLTVVSAPSEHRVETQRQPHMEPSTTGTVKALDSTSAISPVPESIKTVKNQIERLLSKAADDIDAMRLTNPTGNNAYERFLAVLALDPENQDAKSGMSLISKRYVELADTALIQQDFKKAEVYLHHAERTDSANAKILDLRKKIVAMKTKLNQRKKQSVSSKKHSSKKEIEKQRSVTEKLSSEMEKDREKVQQLLTQIRGDIDNGKYGIAYRKIQYADRMVSVPEDVKQLSLLRNKIKEKLGVD